MILYALGKTPILDFEYKNEEDIKQIIEIAKTKSIDDLYKWSKSIWEQVVVGTPEQVSLLTADSIFTFFQDRFATTHYDMAVARVGSGKGAALITFTYQGYRTILGTSMSGASLLDLYGLLECGQIVVAEDELNELKDDSDKRKLYTTGYDLWGLTAKTLDGSTTKRTARFFIYFGFKIFGAENSFDLEGLGGMRDRTFVLNMLKGKPKLYIKNLRKPKLSPKYQALFSDITYFRKVMLVYRLLHANDLFEEIETNIDGRALELTGPLIDLFYALCRNKKLLKEEILPTLSFFLREKGDISKDSQDNIIYSAIEELSHDDQYYSENSVHFISFHFVSSIAGLVLNASTPATPNNTKPTIPYADVARRIIIPNIIRIIPNPFSFCFITKTNAIDAIEANTAIGTAALRYDAPLATLCEV